LQDVHNSDDARGMCVMAEQGLHGSMNEDLQHLEAELHRIVMIARTLARETDAIAGEHWNEPYAYRACNAAEAATRNLRRELERRWLVTPLDAERPQDLPPKTRSYPRVTQRGSNP